MHPIASSTGLRFRGGHGSCVIDDYTTSKATYREIACFGVRRKLECRGGRRRTDLRPTSGWEALLAEGPAAEAIIAACSIPGIFPGVVLVGSRLSTDIAR